MKRDIIIKFVFAVVIISTISALEYHVHGWRGLVVYLLFAGLCLTPAILKARSILKREKGG